MGIFALTCLINGCDLNSFLGSIGKLSPNDIFF
jgi:hypothetical protein